LAVAGLGEWTWRGHSAICWWAADHVSSSMIRHSGMSILRVGSDGAL